MGYIEMCSDCVFYDMGEQKRTCSLPYKARFKRKKCVEARPAVDPDIARGLVVRQVDSKSGKWVWFSEGLANLPSESIEKLHFRHRILAPHDDHFNTYGQDN